jgi:hypothetical protein
LAVEFNSPFKNVRRKSRHESAIPTRHFRCLLFVKATFRKYQLMKTTQHVFSALLGLALLIHGSLSGAQQDGKGGCTTDSIGQIYCSPPNGGIMKDSIGRVVCGPGQCIKSSIGQIICSSQPGGYSAITSIGQIVCTEGCQQASQSTCQRPR